MLRTERAGEIVAVGPILDPQRAVELGDTVLRIFTEFCVASNSHDERGSMLIVPSDSKTSQLNEGYPSNGILIGKEDQKAVDVAVSTFQNFLIDRKDQGRLDLGAEFFIGNPGGGDWHVDGKREYRLLVNLSRLPLKLLIGTKWRQKRYDDFFTQKFKMLGPIAHKPIIYNTGEGVLVDNMCDTTRQTPHAGTNSPGKVIMRVYTPQPK